MSGPAQPQPAVSLRAYFAALTGIPERILFADAHAEEKGEAQRLPPVFRPAPGTDIRYSFPWDAGEDRATQEEADDSGSDAARGEGPDGRA